MNGRERKGGDGREERGEGMYKMNEMNERDV